MSGTGRENLAVSGSNMGPTLAVPTPYGCIGCKLPQPDYPPALIVFMFCAMVITIVVDLIGNSMVILAVSKNKKLRNSGKLPFPFPTQRAATPGVLISAPGTGNPWTGPAPRFPASPSGDVLPGTP